MIGADRGLAEQLLRNGEIVAIPTETVYGLAADALSEQAALKIFQTKKRPAFNPLIVHVASLQEAFKYISVFPPLSLKLAKTFWPGPLTLILPKVKHSPFTIPDLVTAGLPTVALRVPNHPLTLSLLAALPFPLAAPSANPSGKLSPTAATHVHEELGTQIAYILDGGNSSIGIESTVVKEEEGILFILRKGSISPEQIELVTGVKPVFRSHDAKVQSPGSLLAHYAPDRPIYIGSIPLMLSSGKFNRPGIISFTTNYHQPYQFILSPNYKLEEAARNLFRGLRYFNEVPVDCILAELVPDQGIGLAINDRLSRAAHTFQTFSNLTDSKDR